jgi:hypothetical protein
MYFSEPSSRRKAMKATVRGAKGSRIATPEKSGFLVISSIQGPHEQTMNNQNIVTARAVKP